MKTLGQETDVYLATVARLEPDIAMIDAGAYYASAAISLKRTADALTRIADMMEFDPNNVLSKIIARGLDASKHGHEL